jgi:hypothetical protein
VQQEVNVQLKMGQALTSAVDDTAVIVTKAPAGDVLLTCGGVEMVPKGVQGGGEPDPSQLGGSLLGKRYVDAGGVLEVLCTKGGRGTLALDGVALEVQEAKSLPASD